MTDKWDTNVGQLRIVGGMRQDPPKNLGSAENRPLLPIPSRGKGRIFVLVELSGEVYGRDELSQDLANAVMQEYLSTPGTVTYGLRQAILLANTQLLRANARVSDEHRRGGIACVVVRENQCFVAQIGWPTVYLVHAQEVQVFPDDLDPDDMTMLGDKQAVDPRLFQATLRPGDTVLMVDAPLARQLDSTHLGRIVSGGISRTLTNLEAMFPEQDYTAMVLQASMPEGAREGQRTFSTVEQSAVPSTRQPARQRTPPSSSPAAESAPSPQAPIVPGEPPPEPRELRRPPTATQAGPSVGKQAQTALSSVVQGARTLGERILPDRPARSSAQKRQRARRSRNKSQSTVQPKMGLAAAIAIPVIALLVVGGFSWYRNWSTRSQFEAALNDMQIRRELALGAAERPVEARDHWLGVIDLAQAAETIQPGDERIATALGEAATEIDRIDGVTRLGQAFQLYDYTAPGSTPGRVIVAGLDVYVLDPGAGKVYRHTLNEERNAIANVEAEQVLLQEALPVNEQPIGVLVDMAWMKDGGERQAGALLVVDRNGTLIEYDPSWGQFRTEVLGGRDVWRDPVAVQTFDSNLYILDAMADQIWKYPGQQYANAPAPWIQGTFSAADTIDIGIDGSIYVLHRNGRLERFFGGQVTPFSMTRLPQPLTGANALYLETEDIAQYIYVADAAEARIVQLDREGVFVRQLRPQPDVEETFHQLNGMFVDERGAKLYYTAGTALYVTVLPGVPG